MKRETSRVRLPEPKPVEIPRHFPDDCFANQTIPLFEVGEFVARKRSAVPFSRIVDRIFVPHLGWRYGENYVAQSSNDEAFVGGGCGYWANEDEIMKLTDPIMKMRVAIWSANLRIEVREKENKADQIHIEHLMAALAVARGTR